jgi:hypothetical protein
MVEKWNVLFDRVVLCRDVSEFNRFVSGFIECFGLKGEDARRVYWALFYRWKNSLGVRKC